MKKLLYLALCAVLITNIAPLQIEANELGGEVNISEDGNTITIGNGYLQRTFENVNGKWKTVSIDNKRINETFEPAEGSEDFVINLVDETGQEKPETIPPKQVIDRTGWTATLKNKKGVLFDHPEYLFDGDKNTYVDEYQKAGLPISLEINLGSKQTVSSFSFLKRPGYKEAAYGLNGTLGEYKVYVSENGKDWNPAGEGEFTKEDYNLHEEDGLYNVGDTVYANLDSSYQTQYVKIEMLSDALGGTEEFSGAEINLYSDTKSTGLPQKEISLNGKNVTFKGEATNTLTDGNLNFAVKGNVNDEIIIDLGETKSIGSFAYQKRPGYQDANYGLNGTLGKYEVYVSDNGEVWNPAGKGEFAKADYNLHSVVLTEDTQTSDGNYKAGDTLYNVGDLVYGNLDSVYNTRYVKIVPKSDCIGGTSEFQASEIKLFEDQKWEPEQKDTDIRSSELTVSEDGVSIKDNEVRISFDTYEKDGINWDIDMVTLMEDGKHYMNSYLEITADKPDGAAIDYIDFDNFVIPDGTKGVWSIPDENNISSMWIGKHELMLGQPIYADGLFFGSEFPAQDTDINDDTNAMQIRYYSGKTISKMAEDGQSVSEDGKTLRTWNNVVGAAQGTPTDVVQTDFFDYIEDIATPSDFRKQYNSWYDNMMNISDESVEKSFLGAEKGLAENGVEPLDSYVVDDGWNNYNNEVTNLYRPGESGTTNNQTGFWEFNSKFPNELYTSTELTNKFQSSFGVWVGPQGGYNFFGDFAKYLEAMGTGEMQSNSALGNVVCTGSRTYLKNFENRFIDYQTRFNIDYWKWDGFASRPCDNPNHNHMTGGDHNMYFTSDMWEAWTDLIENVRAAREKEGKGLWINATCYVNLSPWLLQWVNTIWIQDSGDTGEAGDPNAARHQQKIYYRDKVYYNLYKTNQIQFPLKNIYNHDPIYGVSDGSKATTDVFREFLFDNAMRGTAFWELYYSPSMIDDAKWKVTADALDFAETNHNVLKNAKMFVQEGKDPTNGVYGYSAWNDEKGFVSFVNPTSEEQTYTLKLDNIVGVPTSMKGLKEYSIYPYVSETNGKTVSYGDVLKVTLKPFSSQIYQYGNTDTKAPEIVSAKIKDKDTVEVRFDERVSNDIEFKVNGTTAKAELKDDYRTFEVAASDLKDNAKLSVQGIKDIYGNESSDYNDEIRTANNIVKIDSRDDIKGDVSETVLDNGKSIINLKNKPYTVAEKGISGNDDFSISMTVDTKSSDTILMKQGKDFQLSIDKDGYVVFDVNGQKVSSKEDVTTIVEHASGTFGTDKYKESTTKTETIGKVNDGKMHTVQAVRETNGVLKLYVDGRLSASAYDGDNNNYDLTGDEIVLGSQNYAGFVGGVEVKNSAIYYDDAEKFADSFGINATSRQLSKEGWTAEACSQANDKVAEGIDGAAASVLDNNEKTYWHSNYSGKDTCNGTHTLTVDFGKETTFDNIEYVARPGGGNGTWTSAVLYGVDKETGKETKLAEVSDLKLTSNRYVFAFDKLQNYDGVRFEVTGVGGYASAAEINATLNLKALDSNATLDLQKEAQKLYDEVKANSDNYTKDSYQKFVEAYEMIMNMNAFASKDETVELRDNLMKAYDALESSVTVDKDELYNLLTKYEGYKESDYTKESWDPFAKAYANASSVYSNDNATQKQVDEAIEDLEKAANALVKAEVETDPITPPEEPKEPGDKENSDEVTIAPDKNKTDDVVTGIQNNVALLAGLVLLAGASSLGIYKKKRRGIK